MSAYVVYGRGSSDCVVRAQPGLGPWKYAFWLTVLATIWLTMATSRSGPQDGLIPAGELFEAPVNTTGLEAGEAADAMALKEARERILSRYLEGENRTEGKASDMEAFGYVNRLRARNGRLPLIWDDIIYQLALNRSRDMDSRGYLDHVDPEGRCIRDIADDFNVSYGALAENIYGVYGRRGFIAYPSDAVDYWMASRGHRYNLLYEHHTAGAVACHKSKCTFIGANSYQGDTVPLRGGVIRHVAPLGTGGCSTAAEVDAFWADAPKQQDEV